MPTTMSSSKKGASKPPPDEEWWGTLQDIEDLPYEPKPEQDDDNIKDDLEGILDLPPLADADYEDDSGDENHMANFVSLSDDEDTIAEKHSRAEYNFRKRVRAKKDHRKKPYEK